MSPRATATAAGARPGVRELAAQTTREAILRAATHVFAQHGFAGGRVEQISKAAKSHDRMIYYYFGSKEGLFVAVLEDMYRRFNEAESTLQLDPRAPLQALQAVARFMWRYYQHHPEFITLLNTENLHHGKHIARSTRAREYSSPALGVLRQVLEHGVAQGLFREEVSARDVYLMIASMGYFYWSNRYTLSAFLGEELGAPAAVDHWESFLTDSVVRTVMRGAAPAAPVLAHPAIPTAATRPRPLE